jgi:hypothetical protein
MHDWMCDDFRPQLMAMLVGTRRNPAATGGHQTGRLTHKLLYFLQICFEKMCLLQFLMGSPSKKYKKCGLFADDETTTAAQPAAEQESMRR